MGILPPVHQRVSPVGVLDVTTRVLSEVTLDVGAVGMLVGEATISMITRRIVGLSALSPWSPLFAGGSMLIMISKMWIGQRVRVLVLPANRRAIDEARTRDLL
jgi:hypothetical protein